MESYQEKARTLSERFGISPAAAMKALEECDGDILDAVIRLESEGVIKRTSANYSTSEAYRSAQQQSYSSPKNDSAKDENFFDKVVRLFLRGIDTSLSITREGKELVSLPVILFIILLIAAFKAVAIVMIVGLFAGCKYRFCPPEEKNAKGNGEPPANI